MAAVISDVLKSLEESRGALQEQIDALYNLQGMNLHN